MERIGSFQIGKPIGQGTFCEVRLARHILTDEPVAVKVFRRDQPDKVRQASRQWSIMKQLQHPNIVRAYQLIETSSNIYLFMEYVEKGELFDYIRLCGKIQQLLAAKILWQLIMVIQYLQSCSVAHRDLKPQNILLTSNLDIKVADFGLSTKYDHPNSKLSDCCGSPCYALPEMLLGERYKAVDVDVWSMGVTLFAMVNGHLPFQETNAKRLHAKIMENRPKYAMEASPEVRELIGSILNRDIRARYGLKEVKYHRWLVKNNKEQYEVKGTENHGLSQSCIKEMELFGIEPQYSMGCLKDGYHNFATTLYYLLEKKAIREGDANYLTSGTLGTIPSLRDSTQSQNILDFIQTHKQQLSQINPISHSKTSKIESKFSIKLSEIKHHRQSASPNSNPKTSRTKRKNSRQARTPTSSSTLAEESSRKRKPSKRSIQATHPTGSRVVVNQDYFRESKRTLRKSKKKISMYDKSPADFVTVHEYQSSFGVTSRKPSANKS